MAKNIAIFGIYPHREAVEEAVNALRLAGFRSTDVSVLLPQNLGTKDLAHEKHTKAPEGASAGAASGAVIGGTLGWLAAIGAIAIPGIGPLVAAGPIIGVLAGVGAGGATGGLVGALAGLGIPEYEAKRYDGRVRDGGILLSVHCDDGKWADRAATILKQSGAEDIARNSEEKGDFASGDKPKARNVWQVPEHPLSPALDLSVADIMSSNVHVIDAGVSVEKAAADMRNWDIGFLPVSDGDRIVGVITDRDIAVRLSAQGGDPARTPVRSVMTTDFLACDRTENIMEASRKMNQRGVRRLLVLDSNKRLAGVVSANDIAKRTGVGAAVAR